MVCLTSCVFRSIRFSGFARPHNSVRREGELYAHVRAVAREGGALHRMRTSRGRIVIYARFCTAGEPPPIAAAQRASSPCMPRTTVSCRPRRRIRLPPPYTQAPRLTPQRNRPRDRRSFLMYRRDPCSSSSPLSPCKLAEPLCIYQELGSGRRAGHTRCRTRRLPNAIARNISPYHVQDCETANTTGWFACCSLPERSLLAGTEKPAPQGNLEMRA